eukprot:9482369-Pyramimonas_sp.AAC.1
MPLGVQTMSAEPRVYMCVHGQMCIHVRLPVQPWADVHAIDRHWPKQAGQPELVKQRTTMPKHAQTKLAHHAGSTPNACNIK